MTAVLIVDDDGDVVLTLTRALKASGLDAKLHGASTADKAKELFLKEKPEVVVLDLCLEVGRGVESGFELLRYFVREDSCCRVIILTGHGSIEHGIRSISDGAANFLEKPADIPHLKVLIEDGITQSKLKRAYLELREKKDEQDIASLIVGESPAIKKVIADVKYAASTSQPVLLTGETGAGKGVCAAAIHKLSNRSKFKFIRFQPHFGNADMVHSDLFGHKSGSFTGAEGTRSGLLLEATKGTFFLDEVDETPLQTQVALLGVLQEKKFRPVGSDTLLDADFRLISATNIDIQEAMASGKVRQDFYHRIAHFTIEIPPLRERLSDIPLLAENFLSKLQRSENINVFGFSDKALETLMNYSWPGNVRELEATLEGCIYRAQFNEHRTVEADDINLSSGTVEVLTFQEKVAEYKHRLVMEALAKNENNQAKAAKSLGIDRGTLIRIMNHDK